MTTTRKGGKKPEGVELFVAKSGCRVVIPHGVAFDPVPDAEVIKKQFTVGEGSRTGISHPNFFSNQIFRIFNPGALTNHKLCRCPLEECNRKHVFITIGVVFQHAVSAEVDVP